MLSKGVLETFGIRDKTVAIMKRRMSCILKDTPWAAQLDGLRVKDTRITSSFGTTAVKSCTETLAQLPPLGFEEVVRKLLERNDRGQTTRINGGARGMYLKKSMGLPIFRK
jgi:hypothetical protein